MKEKNEKDSVESEKVQRRQHKHNDRFIQLARMTALLPVRGQLVLHVITDSGRSSKNRDLKQGR